MQIKENIKAPVTGFCEGNSQVIGGFPTLRASNAENVSIWWRHHGRLYREYLEENDDRQISRVYFVALWLLQFLHTVGFYLQ